MEVVPNLLKEQILSAGGTREPPSPMAIIPQISIF